MFDGLNYPNKVNNCSFNWKIASLVSPGKEKFNRNFNVSTQQLKATDIGYIQVKINQKKFMNKKKNTYNRTATFLYQLKCKLYL